MQPNRLWKLKNMETTMKKFRLMLLLAASVPMVAHANDFPTADRVEYVLECMMNHPGKQEYLYKCSCTIDQIAQEVGYSEYVEISTALRHQTLSGPGGAAFRDPESVKAMANKYKALQAKARKACYVQ
jgi:AraC-like DNA-binding protein